MSRRVSGPVGDPVGSPVGRAAIWLPGLLAAMILSACATRTDVKSQVNALGLPTYELRGTLLSVLDAEVQRLCPNGAEVLRRWQRHERAEAESGLIRRWTLDLVDKPTSQAQLQVVCRI